VANKSDIWKDTLSEEKMAILNEFRKDLEEDKILEMSTKDDEESVAHVKTEACEILLQHRVEQKFKTKKADSILNRIHVAEPQARDKKARPAFIPASVFEKRAKKKDGMDTDDEEDEEDMVLEFGPGMDAPKMPKKSKYQIKTERDIELELGDDYILDLQKNYDIAEEEKYDVIPETWNGHNIADYVDPDIMKKLEALEKEEELREQAGFYNSEESEEEENIKEIRQLASKIRVKKKLMKNDQKMNNTKKPVVPRTTLAKKRERSVSRLKGEFKELGVDMDGTGDANFTKTRKRGRSASLKSTKRLKLQDGDNHEDAGAKIPRDKSGIRDPEARNKLKVLAKKMQKRKFATFGKAGESDRKITTKMPKHLFAGKRGTGKTQRR
jgi:nucleolar GTP-binding protein